MCEERGGKVRAWVMRGRRGKGVECVREEGKVCVRGEEGK